MNLLINLLKKDSITCGLKESKTTNSLYFLCQFEGHNHPKIWVRVADHKANIQRAKTQGIDIDVQCIKPENLAKRIKTALLRRFSNPRKRRI